MRGRERQAAASLVVMLTVDLFDVVDFGHDLAGQLDDLLSGRRDFGQLLAHTQKNLHPQFVFEQPNLLTDARLRGIQSLGRGG